MKKLFLVLALFFAPTLASAQCSGVFTNNTVCGNATGSNNNPRMTPSTSFPAGPLIVGSTVIQGGTNLRFLYDNGGVLGEYSIPLTVPQGGTGAITFSASLPLIGNGAGAITQGTRTGNTTLFATASGAFTPGDLVKTDANGNLIDGGSVPTFVNTVYAPTFGAI